MISMINKILFILKILQSCQTLDRIHTIPMINKILFNLSRIHTISMINRSCSS